MSEVYKDVYNSTVTYHVLKLGQAYVACFYMEYIHTITYKVQFAMKL